jgi:hypothetical protein
MVAYSSLYLGRGVDRVTPPFLYLNFSGLQVEGMAGVPGINFQRQGRVPQKGSFWNSFFFTRH